MAGKWLLKTLFFKILKWILLDILILQDLCIMIIHVILAISFFIPYFFKNTSLSFF